MISNRVREYIAKSTFCPEYLFKDWESFLDVLYSEGGHVSAILWWDHCLNSEHSSSVGMGGYIDPWNPDYVYAETQSWDEDLETMSLAEIKEHISGKIEEGLHYNDDYISHDLVPSFYLCE